MDGESLSVRQSARRLQILRATMRLLRQHGAGITTAQIAAEASCSKETLYSWFGDRDGILLALAREQARGMFLAMADRFESVEGDLPARLRSVATLLLDIMTGDAAIAVNRVAMAHACSDDSTLGRAVMSDWNSQVVEPFVRLLREGNEAGELAIGDFDEAFNGFIGLLVGDRQRRLLLGDDVRPQPAEMSAIASRAVDQFFALYGK